MLKREREKKMRWEKIKIPYNIRKKSTAEALIIHDNVYMHKGINKNTPTASRGASFWVCVEHGAGLLDVDQGPFYCRGTCMTLAES